MAIYKIIFKGEITSEGDQANVEKKLGKLFKISEDKSSLLFNGKAHALRKGLEIDDAIAMQQKFSNIGIVTHLVKEEVVAENITSQETVNKLSDIQDADEANSPSFSQKIKDNWHTYSAFSKTAKAKTMGGIAVGILVALQVSAAYFADCDSGKTKSALKKIIRSNIAHELPSAEYDIELSQISELGYDKTSNTYTCKCKINIIEPTGEQEAINVAYQVAKIFPSKSPKVTLIR